MSNATANAAELFSVKGMVALVRDLHEFMIALLFPYCITAFMRILPRFRMPASLPLRSLAHVHEYLLTRILKITGHRWRNRYSIPTCRRSLFL